MNTDVVAAPAIGTNVTKSEHSNKIRAQQIEDPLVADGSSFDEYSSSKYPPAKPEALVLLAPQRGLIATGEKQIQMQQNVARSTMSFDKTKATAGEILPEFSKFDCLPGRAGGTPD